MVKYYLLGNHSQQNMETIIRKAIEGGYPMLTMIEDLGERKALSFASMEHSFWQALGKSCRWHCIHCEGTGNAKNFDRCFGCGGKGVGGLWKKKALSFHEINLTEGWEKAIIYLQESMK